MARLDKLIQVMHEQRADSLQLAVGKPAALLQNGSVRHLTREALSETQIQGLVREIASPEVASQLGAGKPVTFAYRSPTGEIQVELTSGAEGSAVLRPVAASTAYTWASRQPTYTTPSTTAGED